MRESLERLATFAVCVVAVLPVPTPKVTAHSFAPKLAEQAKTDVTSNAAVCSPLPQSVKSDLVVRVTAYAAVPRCTKKINPDITASGRKISRRDHYHLIALSPDVAGNFKFGDRFRLEVDGMNYFVEYCDKMPDRHRESIDFLLPSVKLCNAFGVKTGKLSLIGASRVTVR